MKSLKRAGTRRAPQTINVARKKRTTKLWLVGLLAEDQNSSFMTIKLMRRTIKIGTRLHKKSEMRPKFKLAIIPSGGCGSAPGLVVWPSALWTDPPNKAHDSMKSAGMIMGFGKLGTGSEGDASPFEEPVSESVF